MSKAKSNKKEQPIKPMSMLNTKSTKIVPTTDTKTIKSKTQDEKSPKGKPNRKRTTGFARTKNIPHKNHPAFYKKRKGVSSDEIDYITFTHSDEVELENKKIKTIEMKENINSKSPEEKNRKTYAYPKVYVGKRSALGKESNEFNLSKKNKEQVDELFETLPKEYVTYTSNSKSKKPSKR